MQCNNGKRRLALLRGGFAGLCAALAMAAAGSASAAPTETVLHSFTGSGSDGAIPDPRAGLIAARVENGILYGTTLQGGLIAARVENGNLYGRTILGGGSGHGVVFKLSPSGTETALPSFTGSEGAIPGGLIADRAGKLYGTTELVGPSGSGCGGYGCGVVVKLTGTGFVP